VPLYLFCYIANRSFRTHILGETAAPSVAFQSTPYLYYIFRAFPQNREYKLLLHFQQDQRRHKRMDSQQPRRQHVLEGNECPDNGFSTLITGGYYVKQIQSRRPPALCQIYRAFARTNRLMMLSYVVWSQSVLSGNS
jgi:hypothetical protein